jgi:hypothetical protein
LDRTATKKRLATMLAAPYVEFMLRFEGVAMIGELIAAACLIVALIGFRICRSTPWLVCAAFAAAALLTTVVMIADVSST